MNDIKIGILTFHNTTNYGATLQTFALQYYLNTKCSSVEIIDYRPRAASKAYFRALFFNRKPLWGLRKLLLFKKFRNRYLKVTDFHSSTFGRLYPRVSGFTHIFCGSDEIWNINSFRGFDDAFFLKGLERGDARKISYAASVGESKSFGDNAGEIRYLLQRFSLISVRDKTTQRILSKECNLTSDLVLDPTFLVDFDVALTPITPPPIDDFILVYGTLSLSEQEFLKIKAKALRLTVVSVGYYNSCADISLTSISVEEWVSYFREAKFVATTFFHGVIFALKYSKDIYVFDRSNKNAKILGLSQCLDLNVSELDTESEGFCKLHVKHYRRGDGFEESFREALANSRDFIDRALRE